MPPPRRQPLSRLPARVAHVATRLPVGGMESVVASLVRRVPPAEYQSEAWCLEEAGDLGRELRAAGFATRVLHKQRRRDFALFVRLARLMRERRIAILHCHDELSWFYGAVAAASIPGTRVVVTMHGRRRDMSRRHRLEQRLLALVTDRIVCVSRFLRQQIVDELEIDSDRIEVVPNGVPFAAAHRGAPARSRARRLLGVGDADFVIGTVAELSAVKNIALAIEAVALAVHAVPRLRFVVIGEGPLRASLEGLARRSGVAHVVRFLGLRRDVPELLPGLDLYVCSSNYEGIALSILEAMMQGIPVVATAVGGNPEVLQDGRAGVLVEAGSVTQTAAALVRLAGDPDERAAVAASGRTAAEDRHGVDRMIDEYGRVYAALLARSSDPPRALDGAGDPTGQETIRGLPGATGA